MWRRRVEADRVSGLEEELVEADPDGERPGQDVAPLLAGVALDETQLTLRGRDDTLFDRLALYRRFGMDARVVRGVLRVPRSRLGDDWQEILLTLLEETIAANTPAQPGARTALAAGQS